MPSHMCTHGVALARVHAPRSRVPALSVADKMSCLTALLLFFRASLCSINNLASPATDFGHDSSTFAGALAEEEETKTKNTQTGLGVNTKGRKQAVRGGGRERLRAVRDITLVMDRYAFNAYPRTFGRYRKFLEI